MPESTRHQGHEGAQWASGEELRADGWFDPSGWPLGRLDGGSRVYLPRERQRAHALVIAPPGSGKSRGLLVPALLSEAAHPPASRRSLLVLDPKGELYRLTRRTLARTHQIVVWNPATPHLSTTFFDALAYIGSPRDEGFSLAVQRVAGGWYAAMGGAGTERPRSDPYWDNQAIAALSGLIMARAAEEPGLTMAGLVDFLGSINELEAVEYVTGSALVAARLQGTIIRNLLESQKTAAIVFGELRRRLVLASSPTVARTIGRPSIDVGAFLDRPTVIYLQVGAGSRELQPLLSVALSTLLWQLEGHTTAGRLLRRDVRVVVDELQNIGELRGLDGALNTLRGVGVGFLLATQTRAGLKAVYGELRGEAIIGGCNTLLGLGGLAPEDASWFSGQLGKRTWEQVTTKTTWRPGMVGVPLGTFTSWNPRPVGPSRIGVPVPHRQTQERHERRTEPLATADSLRVMDRRVLVVPTRLQPFLAALELYTGE